MAVPTGVQVFAWIGTMWKGRPELHMPMLHILGFFVTFVIGGLTGVMVAVVPFDWQAHDTAFITAHLHYVLFGGFVFPMLAGIYYWLPLVSGRKRLFRLGELAFALIFVGFHGTFLAMHWVGLLGQRRRIDSYDAETGWGVINFISSVSSFVMAIGLAMVLVDIIIHGFVAVRGPRNPWRAGTLEWAGMSPPASYNFASLPNVRGRSPLSETPDLANRLAKGEGYLGAPDVARRETLMVDAASGRPEMLVIYPGNTRLPMLMAAVTGGFFLSILLKLFWLTPLALAGVAALALLWVWQLGARADQGPQKVGRGTVLPLASEGDRSPGWWGSTFLLVANGTFFGSLLFGYAFLWTVAPGWPPAQWLAPSWVELGFGIGTALVAALAQHLSARRNRAGTAPMVALAPAFLATVATAAVFGALLLRLPPPDGHAYAATLLILGAYGVAHALLVGLMQGFLILQVRRGFTSPQRRAVFAIVTLWSDYLAAITALILLAAHLPGMIA
ncbi:hypothetical protein A3720_12185 [Sulfitobacter sp. HI0021]|nr:hypothetical protein A3720_12185 [Sulfitobacter sp. HI0021]